MIMGPAINPLRTRTSQQRASGLWLGIISVRTQSRQRPHSLTHLLSGHAAQPGAHPASPMTHSAPAADRCCFCHHDAVLPLLSCALLLLLPALWPLHCLGLQAPALLAHSWIPCWAAWGRLFGRCCHLQARVVHQWRFCWWLWVAEPGHLGPVPLVHPVQPRSTPPAESALPAACLCAAGWQAAPPPALRARQSWTAFGRCGHHSAEHIGWLQCLQSGITKWCGRAVAGLTNRGHT